MGLPHLSILTFYGVEQNWHHRGGRADSGRLGLRRRPGGGGGWFDKLVFGILVDEATTFSFD